MIVAVDGPAGSGKSTVAAELARRLGLAYVDTGAMYRALALKVVRDGVAPDDEAAVGRVLEATDIAVSGGATLLDGHPAEPAIRSPEVTEASSVVAQHGAVRRWMVERQRAVAREAAGGAVVEGRDIGTVVLPDADLKIFLTASEEQRARRRAEQRGGSQADARAEVSGRDARDSARAHSPLRAAADAVVVDTTEMSFDQVLARVLGELEQRDLL